MKKLHLLKTIVDFSWISFRLGYSILIIFCLFILFSKDISDFNFTINGIYFKKIGIYEKILFVLMTLVYGFLLYTFYQFKKLLLNFTRRKIFIDDTILLMKKIGNYLIISSFIYTIPVFVYQIFSKNIILNFGLSNFIILIGLGLFFLVLSEIFKISKLQKEENELTV